MNNRITNWTFHSLDENLHLVRDKNWHIYCSDSQRYVLQWLLKRPQALFLLKTHGCLFTFASRIDVILKVKMGKYVVC